MQNSDALLELVLAALDDLQANDVRVLDVRGITSVTDFMVIASGRSNRHVKALAEAVVEQSKLRGYQPMGVEGEDTGEWVLVDLCDVITHVMLPRARDFYQLEKLWSETETVAAGGQNDE